MLQFILITISVVVKFDYLIETLCNGICYKTPVHYDLIIIVDEFNNLAQTYIKEGQI